MDYGALIQAAIGIVGELIASGKEDEAKAVYTRLQTEVAGIPLPPLEEIAAQQLGPSAMESVTTDPRLETAQMQALGGLDEVAQGGLGQVDKAQLNALMNQLSRRQRAGAAGIEADMAGRGLGGTAVDYATRAQLASDSNQQASEAAQGISAQALQNRLNAIGMKGELAGRIRGQSFGEKSKKAEAMDTINKINAGYRERAQYHNAGLPQQRFQNQLAKVGAQANPAAGIAGLQTRGADNTRGLYAGVGAAAGKWANSLDDDEDDKK